MLICSRHDVNRCILSSLSNEYIEYRPGMDQTCSHEHKNTTGTQQ